MHSSWNFASRAEPSWKFSEPSRAKPSRAGRLREASWIRAGFFWKCFSGQIFSKNFWLYYLEVCLLFYKLPRLPWLTLEPSNGNTKNGLQNCLWLETLNSFNQNSSSARVCYIFAIRAGPKKARAEPSRAGRPLARAESELSRAELSSGASLVNTVYRVSCQLLSIFPTEYKYFR